MISLYVTKIILTVSFRFDFLVRFTTLTVKVIMPMDIAITDATTLSVTGTEWIAKESLLK